MIVKATLIKTATDDGLVVFRPEAQPGHEYLVNLNSIRRQQAMTHLHDDGRSENHHKDIIYTWDGAWLPLACLRVELPDGTVLA